jgi:hypothetical protein
MFRSWFGRKAPQAPGNFVFLQLQTDGLPEIWMLNHKVDVGIERSAFPWHLTIDIAMAGAHAIGLPTDEEQRTLTAVRETLDATLLADRNALWFGSITWNKTRQLVYRVRDPSVANEYLATLVASPAAMRPMQYRMVEDASWEQAEYYLEPLRHALSSSVPRSRLMRVDGKAVVVDD